MPVAHPWLPAGAGASAQVRSALNELVSGWSRAWFPKANVRVRGEMTRIAEPTRVLNRAVCHSSGEGLAILLASKTEMRLGIATLDIAALSAHTSADEELLRHVGSSCLEDLKKRAVTALGIASPQWSEHPNGHTATTPTYRLAVAEDADAPLLHLELSAARLAAFVKRLLPAPPRKSPLEPAAAAMARVRLKLSALAGGCDITVSELRDLAPGDVLILDRAVNESMPIAINGHPVKRGQCTLEDRAPLSLKITQPLSGNRT